MTVILLLIGAIIVAFANGANSVFKGVATIYGSGVASYRVALAWATLTTFAGSVASIFLATELLKRFSGQGLVDDKLVSAPPFLASVALGTGLTVLGATRLGAPISTTHALMGALSGAGWMAAGMAGLNFVKLGSDFIAPLLFSPIIAGGLAAMIWGLYRISSADLSSATDLEGVRMIAADVAGVTMTVADVARVTITAADVKDAAPQGPHRLMDSAHFLSAGVVSFARGLNDTPKMAALLLMVPWLTPALDIALVGLIIAIGGVLAAQRVAETMSLKITSIDHRQGFVANLTTGILVLVASPLGLPVATTHVAACSLFGIGLVTGQANTKTIISIITAWIVTVPFAAAVASVVYFGVSHAFG